ncbi:hypothetical protein [Paraburkholderia adhaesiva]|uniref:hypothetical protein n=1 Tax=Paraburkholderia adhaesiva TaxID=2883244 RepID=UPI001F3AE7C0|nr:hypothetical protein [Paraburkholderia adhaesiva]
MRSASGINQTRRRPKWIPRQETHGDKTETPIAKRSTLLFIDSGQFIFSDSPRYCTSQEDYFSPGYTHSLQKQLLIFAAARECVTHAPADGAHFAVRHCLRVRIKNYWRRAMASEKTRMQKPGFKERRIRNAACPESIVDE